MDVMNLLESLFRWFHVLGGILWIGLLWFFNWVNANFAPTLDADTRRKVVPELMPRALFWFRWGAALTWITGILLLLVVYYHTRLVLDDPARGWNVLVWLLIAFVFVLPFIYDVLAKGPLADPQTAFIAGVIFAAVILFIMQMAGFSYRGYAIHLGGMFGTVMAYNVWFRIWPSQQQIITAVKNGTAPDPATVALAGLRSKHNTFMSVPLVFMMISQHATWAAGWGPVWLTVIVLVGFGLAQHVFGAAKNVKGF